MNTNDIIQEAAIEAYYNTELGDTEYYKGIVTHFLTHTKEKHGAELVKVDGWVKVTPFTNCEKDIQNVLFQLKDGSLRFGSFLSLDQFDRQNIFVGDGFHKLSSVIRYLPIEPPKTDL
jgi:hypothetical protein